MENRVPPPAPLRPDLRAQWMLDDRVTFLNHGSFGGVPRSVFDEQTHWRRRIEAEPIELLGRRAQELVMSAKQPIGEFLGMNAADFGFVTNATEGVNAILRSQELGPGDELLTTTHVYNAVRQAMRHVTGRAGATYREIDLPLPWTSSDEIAGRVLAGVSPRTKLLVIDHITSPTALLLPVETIVAQCRERGVDVLVDGAHAPGMVALDVSRIGAAYYTGNLHKWVCGPKGSGFVWVRPDLQPRVHPLVVSHHLGEGFSREFGWQGTRDISAWLTVPKAVEFMASLGWDAVMRHNHELAVYVHQLLCGRWNVEPVSPFDGRLLGSMCTVPLPASMATLSREAADRLQQSLYDDHRIEVPIMQWAGRTFARPCCQVYNRADEYERLAEVIESL